MVMVDDNLVRAGPCGSGSIEWGGVTRFKSRTSGDDKEIKI
jgi:hypothetical protein